jgi:hypothetical protein
VEWASFVARGARVGVFDIAAMRTAVVPILVTLVGRGGTHRTTATALLAVVRGWLLRVASTICVAAAAAAASAVVPVTLLGGVVDVVGWRLLLSDGHAELLEPSQLRLDGC